jgi:hypothetical protein
MLDYARAVPFHDYVWNGYDTEDITDYPNRPGFIQLDKAVELEIIRDSEGNPIHPVFDIDEWYNIGEGNQVLVCGDCSAVLDIYNEDE